MTETTILEETETEAAPVEVEEAEASFARAVGITLDQLSQALGREVYEHVARELGSVDVPVLSGPQSQGDVRIRPLPFNAVTLDRNASWKPLPSAGIATVSGQHDHVITGAGCLWTTDVRDRDGLAVGVVRVPAGSTAYMWHAEHGGAGMAGPQDVTSGNLALADAPYIDYAIRRQREFQGLVAD